MLFIAYNFKSFAEALPHIIFFTHNQTGMKQVDLKKNKKLLADDVCRIFFFLIYYLCKMLQAPMPVIMFGENDAASS